MFIRELITFKATEFECNFVTKNLYYTLTLNEIHSYKNYFIERLKRNKREKYTVKMNWRHRVIILNRGSMFAFQWREFSPPLSSAHILLMGYHRQKRDRRNCNSRRIPPQPPATRGTLANERAVSSDVMLWRCTYWSGKFASFSSYSIVKACSL